MLREKCLFIGTSSLFLGWLLNTHVLDSNILDLEVFSLFCLLSITYILRCLKVLSLGAWFKLSLPRSPRHSRGGNGTRWQEWRRRRVTKAWRMKTSSPEQRPSRRQMNRETPFPPPRPFASAMMETRHGRTNRERMWSIFSFFSRSHHRLLESPPLVLDSNHLVLSQRATKYCITFSMLYQSPPLLIQTVS